MCTEAQHLDALTANKENVPALSADGGVNGGCAHQKETPDKNLQPRAST